MYEPNDWETGDTITAEKLNRMETGIQLSEGIIIPVLFDEEEEEFYIDTWLNYGDIMEALEHGIRVSALVTHVYDDSGDIEYLPCPIFVDIVLALENAFVFEKILNMERDNFYYTISQIYVKIINHNTVDQCIIKEYKITPYYEPGPQ